MRIRWGRRRLAMEAAKKALENAHRYPDGGSHLLRETLAARTGLAAEEIFVGLGSSEIIDLASRVLLRPGLQGLTSHGSYAPFSVAIRASGAELVLVPQKNFAFDLEAMAKAITPKTGVIYLANPNNPTGTAFSLAELEEFLGRVPESVLVVLDEAYVHYAPSLNRRKSEEIFRQTKEFVDSADVFESVWAGGDAHWLCDWAAGIACRDEQIEDTV